MKAKQFPQTENIYMKIIFVTRFQSDCSSLSLSQFSQKQGKKNVELPEISTPTPAHTCLRCSSIIFKKPSQVGPVSQKQKQTAKKRVKKQK